MREPFTQLYLHLVWSTWDRLPLLTSDRQPRVYALIQSECQRLRGEALAVGGIEDHVHVLLRLPTTISIADLVKQLKGVSSHLISHESADRFFKWQGAYGAFAVTKRHVPMIRDYVLCQEEHHRAGTLHPDLEAVTRTE